MVQNDGKPDFIWHDSSGQARTWFMNNDLFVQGMPLAKLPLDWNLVTDDVTDFNGNGKGEIAIHDSVRRETTIFFLNGPTVANTVKLPKVAVGWLAVAFEDFDGDRYPDVLFRNLTIGEHRI